jgi:hypothetical protein
MEKRKKLPKQSLGKLRSWTGTITNGRRFEWTLIGARRRKLIYTMVIFSQKAASIQEFLAMRPRMIVAATEKESCVTNSAPALMIVRIPPLLKELAANIYRLHEIHRM